MAVTRESPFASRTSRIVLGFTAAIGLCAAVAAAPTTPVVKGQSPASVKAAVSLNDDGLRPLARGPAIRVGRAYGVEDEDCTLVLKPSTDERGRVRYMRSVTCAN
jgi:hypothetical protein